MCRCRTIEHFVPILAREQRRAYKYKEMSILKHARNFQLVPTSHLVLPLVSVSLQVEERVQQHKGHKEVPE